MVSSHNKNGSECIDKNGKVVFKANYEQINDYFDEGYAVVCKKGKAGMIDKKGRELIKPKYNSIYMFSEGLAAVQANGKCSVDISIKMARKSSSRSTITAAPFPVAWPLCAREINGVLLIKTEKSY